MNVFVSMNAPKHSLLHERLKMMFMVAMLLTMETLCGANYYGTDGVTEIPRKGSRKPTLKETDRITHEYIAPTRS